MTVMVQCYAIFWLLTSIASLKMVMERLGADEDDERQKEQRDELDTDFHGVIHHAEATLDVVVLDGLDE